MSKKDSLSVPKAEVGRKTFAVREVIQIEAMVCGELFMHHKMGKGGGKSFALTLADGPDGSYFEERILKEIGCKKGDKLECTMTFRVI